MSFTCLTRFEESGKNFSSNCLPDDFDTCSPETDACGPDFDTDCMPECGPEEGY